MMMKLLELNYNFLSPLESFCWSIVCQKPLYVLNPDLSCLQMLKCISFELFYLNVFLHACIGNINKNMGMADDGFL